MLKKGFEKKKKATPVLYLYTRCLVSQLRTKSARVQTKKQQTK